MNKARLEYEMSVRGVTRSKLCEVLGISRSAFYRKCNGSSEFTQGEIQKIVDYLNLETPVGIFLIPKCLKGHFAPCTRVTIESLDDWEETTGNELE